MGFADYDTRFGAYAMIVDSDDRLLLTLWNGGAEPAWTLPGGEVELHESPEEGAVRELLEETGYHVEVAGFLGIDVNVVPAAERHGSARTLKSVRVVYSARVVSGRLRSEPEPDGSTDEARWVALAEVSRLHRVGLVDAGLALWRAAQ
jgi:8-oxo-dGTP diphosphatase